MLCMLFLERLGWCHCFGKHEGFLPSLRQCCVHVLGMGVFGVRLAGFGRGLVAASELCQLLLSLWPLVLWLCGTAIVRDAPSPKESTMEVQFGDFCVGIFSCGSENFHIFRGCLVAQLKLLSIMTWTELGKSQAVPCCACLRIQPTGFWFPSGGFTSEPFPLTDLSLWGLESQERAGAHSKGFFGSRERAGESGKLNWAFRNHLQKVCA